MGIAFLFSSLSCRKYAEYLGVLMKKIESETYILKRDLDNVPKDCGGIYLFFPRFLDNYEIGLKDASKGLSPSQAQLVVEKVNRLLEMSYRSQYLGVLRDGKAPHIGKDLELACTHTSSVQFQSAVSTEELETLKGDRLLSTLEVVRGAVASLSPIYVGMAQEQTLHTRILQHIDGETSLLSFLKEYHLSFNDTRLQVAYGSSFSKDLTRLYERIFQAVLKPVASIK